MSVPKGSPGRPTGFPADRRFDPPTPALTEGDVMSAADVARLLAVPKSTVEGWARRGIVPSRKRGRRRFYLRWEIQQWLVGDDDG